MKKILLVLPILTLTALPSKADVQNYQTCTVCTDEQCQKRCDSLPQYQGSTCKSCNATNTPCHTIGGVKPSCYVIEPNGSVSEIFPSDSKLQKVKIKPMKNTVLAKPMKN